MGAAEEVGQFDQSWYGPVRVQRRTTAVNYEVVDPDDPQHGKDVVHVSRLKRFYGPTSIERTETDNDDAAPEYEIESVRDVRERGAP